MPRLSKKQIRHKATETLRQIVQEVSQEEETKAEERMPGQVVNGLKTVWTAKDVERAFPIVTFTPEDTTVVTYNGVTYQLMADVEMHVPSIVKDIYTRSRQRTRAAGRGLRALGITIEAGAGGLPPS